MHQKAVLSFLVLLGATQFVVAGRQGSIEPADSPESLARYGVLGDVRGPFGHAMPADWFSTPVPAVAVSHSYVATMPSLDQADSASDTMILYNEDAETTNMITLEVRDRNHAFVSKYLVAVAPNQERTISLSDLSEKGGVFVTLFAPSPFAAFAENGVGMDQLAVTAPVVAELTPESLEASKAGCTSKTRAIVITNTLGQSVDAYANAYVQFDCSVCTISRNYLSVHYPYYGSVFHYGLSRGYGPQCALTVSGLGTARSSGQVFADHTWSKVPTVLGTYGYVGTVKCQDYSICQNQSWTYQLK